MKYCSLDNSSDEDFKDLALTITKFKKNFLGDFYIECFANYLNKEVGIGLYIKSNMQGMVNNDINTLKVYQDGIKIISLGKCSDDFFNAITEIYGFTNINKKLKNKILVECAPLQGNPKNLKNEILRFKCFFNAHYNQDYYAELFINFDVSNLKVLINEKSPEYRNNIIYTLSN